MHQLKIRKKPADLSFSRNENIFGFSVTPWTKNEIETNTSIYISVNIAGSLNPVQLQLNPDINGYAELNLSTILDAHLRYDFPSFENMDDHVQVFIHSNQTCSYNLHIRLANDYTALKFIVDNEQMSTYHTQYFKVIKGGLSKGENVRQFLRYNLLQERQPLLFETDEPIIHDGFGTYLTIICTQDDMVLPQYRNSPVSANLKIVKKYSKWDGSTEIIETITENYLKFGEVVSVPVQLDVKLHASIEISFYLMVDSSEWLTAQQTFYPSPVRIDAALHYHNSLGGITALPLLQSDGASFEYESTEKRIINIHEYISRNVLSTDFEYSNITERRKPSYFTPLLSQQALQDIRDVFLCTNIIIRDVDKCIPYRLDAETFEISETKGMYYVSLHLQSAILDKNYTRSGHIVNNACEPPLDLHVSQKKGDSITVAWAFEPNTFEGELYLTSGALNLGPYQLLGNTGEMTIVNPDIPIVSDKKSVVAKIRAKCKEGFSAYLESETFEILMFMPPFLTNLYATTYRGLGERELRFDNESSYLQSAIINQNDGAWSSIIELELGSPGITTKIGTAGGNFTKVGGFTGTMLKYNPPTEDFTGIDTLEYFVFQNRLLPSAAITPRATGMIYLSVASGEIVDSSAPETGTAVYVSLNPIAGTETLKITNPGSFSLAMEEWQQFEMRFYKDPFKMNPLNPASLGIDVVISFETTGDEPVTEGLYPAVSAITNVGALITKKAFHYTGVMDYYSWYIKDSPAYFVIP